MPLQALPLQKGQALPCVLTQVQLRRHAAGWLLDSQVRQLSPATLSSRRLVTDKLLWFLEQSGMETCSSVELKQFLGYVGSANDSEAGRWNNSQCKSKARPATVSMYHARLRTFYRFLVDEGVIETTPFDSIKPPVCREDQVQPFTQEQINALLHAAGLSACPKRNKAVLLFLLDTGVRASELCALQMADIDLAGQKANVIGKGNKKRTVFFGRNATRLLLAYLKEEPHGPEEPVFFSWDETRSRNALTRSGLRQLMQRLGKAAGIQTARCSPHTFRHTFAVEFLRNGGNQFSLQALLGHTSIAQTRRYVAWAQADAERQHRQYSPGDALKSR